MPHDPHAILFHSSCLDGFASAWIFHKAYPNALFIPVTHGTSPPDLKDKQVIIVDFSYKEAELIAIRSQAKSIKVLDHHQSAFDELKHLPFCHFDLEKSGARLAWEEVYNKKKSPWLIDYIEDQDLWRWKLPNSKEVNAVISTLAFNFEEWTRFSKSQLKKVIEQGKIILRYRQQLVKEHVARAHQMYIGNHLVLVTNCTCKSLVSDVAGALAEGHPFGACYYIDEQGHKVWSLRSTDGGEDCSLIARRYGGGGHAHSAGFRGL